MDIEKFKQACSIQEKIETNKLKISNYQFFISGNKNFHISDGSRNYPIYESEMKTIINNRIDYLEKEIQSLEHQFKIL